MSRTSFCGNDLSDQTIWKKRFKSFKANNFHTRSCACTECKSSTNQESLQNTASDESRSGFNDEILISSTFGDITKDYIDWGNNDTLTYTIFDKEKDNSLVTTNQHSREEEEFIHDTFDELDEIIELDFDTTNNIQDAEVVVVSVDRYRPWGPSWLGVVGQVVQTEDRWFVLWKDSTPTSNELTDFDKNTITHEIGHSLGLSHPNEDPNNPSWNSVDDTIMSYNSSSGQWGTEFTENDLDALEMIWGVEYQGQAGLNG